MLRAPILALLLATTAALFPRPSEVDEVAVARSAAPKEVSANADVYVYHEQTGKFERAVAGSSGVACLVTRDVNPDARYPQCLNAAAVRWVLPLIFEEHTLRHARRSESFIEAYLDSAYRAAYARTNAASRPTSVSYMMSPHQVIYAAPGQRVGRWRPHIMVFSPGASLNDFALTDESRHFGMNSPGSGTAHLLVVVPNWADSTASTRPPSTPPQETPHIVHRH